MPSEFAVTSFLASVADVRWLAEFETYHLLKVLADSKALDLIALPTELSEFLLTWIADVREMLALPAMAARIKGFFFYDLVVTSYLFGDSRRILIYFLGDLLERHAFSEAGFNDDALTERQMCILCHNGPPGENPPSGRTLQTKRAASKDTAPGAFNLRMRIYFTCKHCSSQPSSAFA